MGIKFRMYLYIVIAEKGVLQVLILRSVRIPHEVKSDRRLGL